MTPKFGQPMKRNTSTRQSHLVGHDQIPNISVPFVEGPKKKTGKIGNSNPERDVVPMSFLLCVAIASERVFQRQ